MYWDAWLIWRALGRAVLPRAGGFENQPDLQMQVFLLLDSLLEKVKKEHKAMGEGA